MYNNAISIKMSQEIIMLVDALYGLALSIGSLGFVIAVFEAVGLGLSHHNHKDR
jgi:hypothetical protein